MRDVFDEDVEERFLLDIELPDAREGPLGKFLGVV
jgi:hypothetical protein